MRKCALVKLVDLVELNYVVGRGTQLTYGFNSGVVFCRRRRRVMLAVFGGVEFSAGGGGRFLGR